MTERVPVVLAAEFFELTEAAFAKPIMIVRVAWFRQAYFRESVVRLNPIIKELLRTVGYSISPIRPNTNAWSRRDLIMRQQNIDLVLDIGAHAGGYAKSLRKAGYRGRIFSFEPQPVELSNLRQEAKKSPPWDVFANALGDFDGEAEFFISTRTTSSSLLPMDAEAQVMAGATINKKIQVQVRTIDSFLGDGNVPEGSIYLKCDAQGTEEKILKGAARSLDKVKAVEVELSIAAMYAGQWDFRAALDWFQERDFELFSLEAGFADPNSGRVMQVDAIFLRREPAS